MTSAVNWYLFSPENDLRWIVRRALSKKSWDDEHTGNMILQCKFRAAATFFHWRGAYKSVG